MNFVMIMLKQSIKAKYNYVMWILTVLLKMKIFMKTLINDVEKWFDTSNYSEDKCNSFGKRLLTMGKNKNVIGLFKDRLGRKIMTEFVRLRVKTYAYLMDDDSEKKKSKGAKKCVTKRILKFNKYEDCLFNNKIILQSQ